MTMRCHVPPDTWSNGEMVLDADESHHLQHVMRVEPGRMIEVFDGQGRVAEAEVVGIGRHAVRVAVRRQYEAPAPRVRITLLQAAAREQKMDLILQKATELGAAAILPLVADHSVARHGPATSDSKQARWDRIVLNAAKQCGSAWLPRTAPPAPVIELVPQLPAFDLFLACSLEPDARPLRDVLAEAKPRGPRTIAAAVGPEGDFSARERAALRQAGARPVSLGPLILRAETAAIYVLSVLHFEFL